jgi:hypothetical protein
MTELNLPTDAHPESVDAQVDWPAQARPGAAHVRAEEDARGQAGDAPVEDPAVEALLVRLADVPELPVSAHNEVYAGLHDELAAALNDDVAGQPAGNSPR